MSMVEGLAMTDRQLIATLCAVCLAAAFVGAFGGFFHP